MVDIAMILQIYFKIHTFYYTIYFILYVRFLLLLVRNTDY